MRSHSITTFIYLQKYYSIIIPLCPIFLYFLDMKRFVHMKFYLNFLPFLLFQSLRGIANFLT
nr:MAG TPA: hypothetical protein [Bacteriophage sp.]